MDLKTLMARMFDTARPTFRRFWVPVLLCVTLTLTLSEALTRDPFDSVERLLRVALAVIPGILAAWCAILYWERRYTGPEQGSTTGVGTGDSAAGLEKSPLLQTPGGKNSEMTANLVAIPVAGLAIASTYAMLRDFRVVAMSRHLAICLVLALGCFIVPHVRRRGSLEMYVVRIFSHAAVSALFAAIMFFGLSAITLTVSSLFSLHVTARAYLRIFLWMAGTLAPFLFMAGIPRGTVEGDPGDYPKVLKNLVLFVVTPLLTAYTLVLYVYFAKILVTREWPVGLVGHLVLWYSMVGAAILYFVWPLTGENKWGSAFSYYFPKAVIPLTLMMFAAVGIRVRHYGITENRYYVMVFGAWVLGAMLYLMAARRRRGLVLPISLAIVAVLTVVGPLSSFSVAKWSQNRRFEALLNKYGMLQSGTIVHPTQQVPAEDRREFAEILFYFSRNHSLEDVRYLPRDFKFDEFEEVFGFSYLDAGFPVPPDGVIPKQHRYVRYQPEGQAVDTRGYDILFDFTSEFGRGPAVSLSRDGVEVVYNKETWEIQVRAEGATVWRKSVYEHILERLARYGDVTDVDLLPEDAVITGESEGLRVKLVIASLWGDLSDTATGKPVAGHMLFYVLVSRD
ncbi:MAG TPA: DUF4153 domain-containing protein [Firmicutes bacterium]|nr:DUF4153 domain-containing protein [Candidatus Fermentithermobacillaceae bacterium]